MFFLPTIISQILVLVISALFLSACIADDPLDMVASASLTVSISATPSILSEVQPSSLLLTIRLSESPAVGGLNVGIDSETPNALEQLDFSAAVYHGATLALVNADSSGFTLNVAEQTATVILPVFVDGLAEDSETFTYTLSPSTAYTIDPEASMFSITISDLPPDVLTVGITAAPTELIETEQTVLTLTIRLSEAPPAEGVDITLDSDLPGSLAEFDISAAVFSGATLVSANADSSGFTLNVFEPTAAVALPVFNDGVAEGPETLTYAVQPSEDYAIDPAASAVSVTLFDMVSDVLTVGITAAPTELIETEQTVLTLTIRLSEAPPAEGVDVTLDSDLPGSLAEFNVFMAMFSGATLVSANADSSGFTLNVFEPTATVALPVFNDGVAEGPETLTYAVQPSEDYAIDPAASAVSVTLFDVAL